MIGAAIVFCLPMFMALLAVVYQLIGDWYCMLAFFSLVFSLLIWLPMGDLSHDDKSANDTAGIDSNGVLAPQSHTAASAEFSCRGRVSNLFKLLTLVFVTLFVLDMTNELDKDVKEVRDAREPVQTIHQRQSRPLLLGASATCKSTVDSSRLLWLLRPILRHVFTNAGGKDHV